MPAPPEHLQRGGEVWILEVLGEPQIEELGRPDGDIGVAREVAVDLDGVEDGREKEGETIGRAHVGPDVVHLEADVVGDEHLLGEAPEDLPQAVLGAGRVEGAAGEQLGQQVAGPGDGSGKQLREEAQRYRVFDHSRGGPRCAPVDVDHVREILEDVVADADGECQRQRHGVGVETEAGKHVRERVGEEVEVLERPQSHEVRDKREHEDGPAAPRPALERQPGDEPRLGDPQQQQTPAPVPDGVEGVAHEQQDDVVQPPPARPPARQVEDAKGDGDEEPEFVARQQHPAASIGLPG